MEIAFPNGQVTLSGDLLLPAGTGPFPVFVWCHGSGAATRGWVATWIKESIIDSGFAFLCWDKPGTGKSSGLFYQQSLTNRAQEICSAVEMLKKEIEIDGNRISFCGGSQAGFVLPRVIKELPNAEKLFLIGPGAWAFGEERIYQKRRYPAGKFAGQIGITDQNELNRFIILFEKLQNASDAISECLSSVTQRCKKGTVVSRISNTGTTTTGKFQ